MIVGLPSAPFIFVRVPKTASTSVSDALLSGSITLRAQTALRRGLSRSEWGSLRRFTDFAAHSHWPLQAARDILGQDRFGSFFKFAVVREPIDWIRSYFEHLRRHVSTDTSHASAFPGLTESSVLSAFLEMLVDRPIPPQLAMLCDYEGNLGVDTVARFDRLESDLTAIRESHGVPLRLPLRSLNAAKAPLPYVSRSDRIIIEDLFAEDYEHLGFGDGILRRSQSEWSRRTASRLQSIGAVRFSPWEPWADQGWTTLEIDSGW